MNIKVIPKHYVLLEIPPTIKPIYLLVEEEGAFSELTLEKRDLERFRFEENTHPINTLSQLVGCQDEIDFKVKGFFNTHNEGKEALDNAVEEAQ
jgi:hypothetical protein